MFKNKVVLVTGGSRGIGCSIALKFGEQKASVCINFNSNKDLAKGVVEEVIARGGKAIAIKADVSKENEVKEMVQRIEEEFGAVDILVNNAAITNDSLLLRMKEEQWTRVMDINLKGAYCCAKAVVRGMMKKKYGHIINISSVVAFTGNIGQSNYIASKSGLIGLTKAISLEFASRGIRANAIAPGFIETEMTDSLPENVKNEMKKKIALECFGVPDDIANVVLFLASRDADYITGQTIHVNGGLYLH